MNYVGNKKFAFFAVLGFFMIMLSPLANAQGAPKFKKGTDYAKIRTKLLNTGWKPARMPDADKPLEGEWEYPETDACSGSGLGYCRFVWEKNGKHLVVITVGAPPAFSHIGR